MLKRDYFFFLKKNLIIEEENIYIYKIKKIN